MSISFWMLFWKITFILSLLIFVIMFFYVSIKGYKELIAILFGKD